MTLSMIRRRACSVSRRGMSTKVDHSANARGCLALEAHLSYNCHRPKEEDALPVHDWSRVPAGLFHHFQQDWSIEIARTLNRGLLPKGLSALVEQRAGAREPDVLTVERLPRPTFPANGNGTLLLERPVTRFIRKTSQEIYAARANRILVKHHLGRIVAVIEIVSPGNKDSKAALRDFVDKVIDLLRRGIHVLVIDLFPPSERDPFGIHKAIWDEITVEDFVLPDGKDRVLVSYETGDTHTAFIEAVGVGDALPDMPLFLAEGAHVRVPLEPTYMATWQASPEEMRLAVETGVLPEPEAD